MECQPLSWLCWCCCFWELLGWTGLPVVGHTPGTHGNICPEPVLQSTPRAHMHTRRHSRDCPPFPPCSQGTQELLIRHVATQQRPCWERAPLWNQTASPGVHKGASPGRSSAGAPYTHGEAETKPGKKGLHWKEKQPFLVNKGEFAGFG